MMDIVILTHFTDTFSKTDNDRFLYLSKILSNTHKIEIITSDFMHSIKKHRKVDKVIPNIKVTFLHEPGYKKNICIKRFISHYYWGRKVRSYLNRRTRPDVIFCAVPSLTGSLYAARYCKRTGTKFVIDIQDLWPEAFRMVFDVPILSSALYAPFYNMANRVYRFANAICAVSNTYVNRALEVNNKCSRGTAVYLGTDLSLFDEYAKTTNELEKRKDEIWVIYCGTLGSSYDIKCVIDALVIVKKTIGLAPRFILLGDGPLRSDFENYSINNNVDCLFLGRVPYHVMCSILQEGDIAINPIIKRSAASIINKHADYAAAGLPIINTQESKEYCELVDYYKMGYNCTSGDSDDVAKKIIMLIQNPIIRQEMGRNSRKCAEEKFDRKKTYLELINVITKCDDC